MHLSHLKLQVHRHAVQSVAVTLHVDRHAVQSVAVQSVAVQTVAVTLHVDRHTADDGHAADDT